MTLVSISTIVFLLSKKKLTVAKTEDDSVPLPDPFPLPKHYPRHLEEALSEGKMSHRQKRAFITEVASSMLRFKRYPTRDDYVCVARSIIKKYPFFKQTTGKPYVSYLNPVLLVGLTVKPTSEVN